MNLRSKDRQCHIYNRVKIANFLRTNYNVFLHKLLYTGSFD